MGETSGPNRRRRRKTGRRRTEKRGEIAKGTLRNRRNRGKEAGKQGKETRKQGKEKQEKGRGTAAKDRTRKDRDLVTRFPQKARLGYRVEILLPISACHARKPGRGAERAAHTVASESAGTHALVPTQRQDTAPQAKPRDKGTKPSPGLSPSAVLQACLPPGPHLTAPAFLSFLN